MTKTNGTGTLKPAVRGTSKESVLLAVAGGKAAMPWQTVTRVGD